MWALKTIVSWLAIAATCVSAGFWFWAAAGVKIDPSKFAMYCGLPQTEWGKLKKQTTYNAYAAAATGVSAVLQAVAMALPWIFEMQLLTEANRAAPSPITESEHRAAQSQCPGQFPPERHMRGISVEVTEAPFENLRYK